MEKNFEVFNKISRDDLIKHGLKALKASAQEEELSVNNVSVGVVSASEKFRLLTQSELQVFLTSITEGMTDWIIYEFIHSKLKNPFKAIICFCTLSL